MELDFYYLIKSLKGQKIHNSAFKTGKKNADNKRRLKINEKLLM